MNFYICHHSSGGTMWSMYAENNECFTIQPIPTVPFLIEFLALFQNLGKYIQVVKFIAPNLIFEQYKN